MTRRFRCGINFDQVIDPPKWVRRLAACAALTFTLQTVQPVLADPGADNSLNRALSAWRTGDLATAQAVLNDAIDSGSTDARMYYFRGIIAEQSGNDGTADFAKAASQEIASSSTRIVNQALEKVQGPIRGKIETARESARVEVSADPNAGRTALIYKDAIAFMKSGDLNSAIAMFDRAIADNARDARVYYMRGVALARMGDAETARAAFQQGLALETTYDQVQAVNAALQDIQGDIRQIIEEQAQLGEGQNVVTRQTNQRAVAAKHQQLQNDLLNADSEQRAMLLAEADAARRARDEAAAERILQEEKRQAETDALIKAADADLNQPVISDTAPAANAAPTSGNNAFGVPNNPEMPADVPAAPAATVNPFLTGNNTAANSNTAIDTSWLAPNSELVFYARPAEIITSRFLAPVMSMPEVQTKLDELVQQQGIPFDKMESVTGGMGDLMAKIVGLAMGGGGDPTAAMGQFMNNPSAISVVRMTEDFDLAAMASARGFEALSVGDQTYYVVPSPEVPQGLDVEIPASTIYQVDARTLLTGTEVALQAALNRGPGQSTMPQFNFLSAGSHLTFGFSNPALAAMSGSVPTPQQAPPMIQELVNTLKGQVNGFAFAFSMSASMSMDIKLSLNDASTASAALQPLQQTLQMAQQMYPMAKQQGIPPEMHEVTDVAVGSLAASTSGSILSVSMNVPGKLVTILKNNPDMIQPRFGPPGVGDFPAEDPSQGFQPAPPGSNPSQGFGFPGSGSSPPQN